MHQTLDCIADRLKFVLYHNELRLFSFWSDRLWMSVASIKSDYLFVNRFRVSQFSSREKNRFPKPELQILTVDRLIVVKEYVKVHVIGVLRRAHLQGGSHQAELKSCPSSTTSASKRIGLRKCVLSTTQVECVGSRDYGPPLDQDRVPADSPPGTCVCTNHENERLGLLWRPRHALVSIRPVSC